MKTEQGGDRGRTGIVGSRQTDRRRVHSINKAGTLCGNYPTLPPGRLSISWWSPPIPQAKTWLLLWSCRHIHQYLTPTLKDLSFASPAFVTARGRRSFRKLVRWSETGHQVLQSCALLIHSETGLLDARTVHVLGLIECLGTLCKQSTYICSKSERCNQCSMQCRS